MYISDSPNSIIATSTGYTTNDIVYSFGVRSDITYAGLGGSSPYGTILSKDMKRWSTLSNTSTDVPCRIIWDGFKWIVTRNNTNLLVSYTDISFIPVDVVSATLSCIACNNSIYVGIGMGGIFYGYDGLNWYNSSTGTALINNSSSKQIGKVAWNGNLWVAVGNGATCTIAYSYNGITWTGVSNSKTLFNLTGGAMDVLWNGTLWIAVGASTISIVATSTDGITWSNSNVTIT